MKKSVIINIIKHVRIWLTQREIRRVYWNYEILESCKEATTFHSSFFFPTAHSIVISPLPLFTLTSPPIMTCPSLLISLIFRSTLFSFYSLFFLPSPLSSSPSYLPPSLPPFSLPSFLPLFLPSSRHFFFLPLNLFRSCDNSQADPSDRQAQPSNPSQYSQHPGPK